MRRVFYGLMILMVMGEAGWGQQVIGSFPVMDGGFENQSGTLGNTLSSTAWSRQSGTGSTITSTSGRSGPKYATATVAASTRLLQSPQDPIAANGPAASTAYVVQFYYKSSANFLNFQIGVTTNGTTNPTYSTAATLNSTSGIWTKYTGTVTTPSNAPTTAGIGIIRGAPSASGGPIDVDDFVIYLGSSADNTAPNSPGSVTVNNPTTSSLDVSWGAASGGVDGGGYVVVRFVSSPGANDDPNQNGIYAIGNSVSGGVTGTVRYIGTGTSFTDNSGLSAGTTYYYKVYTVDKAFNYSAESSGNGTTSAGNSTSSDIIRNAGFSEPTNIAYSSYQETDLTSFSLEVAQFDIRDGGGSADADALTTSLTAITFSLSNYANVRRVAIYDGSTEISEVAVSSGTVTFSSLSGLAASDNGSKTFSLRASFNSTVTDNQQFQFTITSATADGAGSTFAAADAGGAASSTTGDANRIEVTATKLLFVQQPSNVISGVSMSPAVSVEAADPNDIRDLDYATDVSITSTGTLTGSPVSSSPSSGLATFSTLTHTGIGTGYTLTAASGSITSAVSNTFNVSYNAASDIIETPSYTYPTDIAYAHYQEATDIQLTETSVEVFGIRIRDGGASADTDPVGTSLTDISFNVTNPGFIRRAALYDGSTELAEVAVSGSPITFTGFTASASDNGTKDLTIRVSFTTGVTDNQQIQFTVSSVTASASGSGFAAANGGGAVSSTTGNNNRIEAAAQKISFSDEPSDVFQSIDFSLTASAVDTFNIADLDNTSSVTLIRESGTGMLSSVTGLTQTLTSGAFSWSDLQLDTKENGVTIRCTNTGALTNDTTVVFDVTVVTTLISDNFGTVSQDPISRSGWTAADGGSSTWELRTTLPSSGYTGASGGANVFTNLSGSSITKTLTYDNNISTYDFSNLQVTFGGIKSGTVPDLEVLYSTDGTSFISAGLVTLGTSWGLNTVNLPVGAQDAANLRIRFSITTNNNSSNNFRIDDFSIIGNFLGSIESDIISADHEQSNIDYASYQSSSINTTSDGVRVWSFTVRDGGGSADMDTFPTILSSLWITKGTGNTVSDWGGTIRQAALYNGTTKVAELTVSGDTIRFTGLSDTTSDNGSRTLDLYLTFESSVIDNQQFRFAISKNDIRLAAHSSWMNTFSDATSSTTGDLNRLEVTATILKFSNEPSSVVRNANFALTVSSADANGNTDEDLSPSVTLSLNTGTGVLSSTAGLTQSLSSGSYTWNDLQYDQIENGVTIKTANGSGLTNDTTSSIMITTGLRDDFNDGNFTTNPTWTGNTSAFSISTSGTLPGGVAVTDGSFLAANASVDSVVLVTSSVATDEWRFSLGTPNYNPSTGNHFGVVLMSDVALSSSITSASWNGYYIRIGVDAVPDSIELWKSSGTTKTKVGSFPSSPTFATGALQNGLNIRITRSAGGQFELFYSTGFTYGTTPTVSAGTLTDNSFSSSSYFGLYTGFANPTATRRVYIDNIITGVISSDTTSVFTKIDAPVVEINSLADTPAEDTVLFSFSITDSASGDEVATFIDSLQISQGGDNRISDWSLVLGGARLTSKRGTPINVMGSVRSDKIVFSGSPLIKVADGTTDSLYMHVYLKNAAFPDTADNNRLNFNLSVDNFFGPVDSSRFHPSWVSISDSVLIDVDATQISFSEIPASVSSGENFTLKVLTSDIHGSRDEDASTSVTLEKNSGSGTLSSTSGLTQSLVSGIYTWLDLKYNGAPPDSFTIRTTNAGSLINDTTTVIRVTRPPIVISEYANDATGGEVIELMVVDGPLDIRNWAITDNEPSTTTNATVDGNEGYYGFSNSYVWQYLPSGTIIRINWGSSSANDTTIDQKNDDFLIVQNTNQTSGLIINPEGGGASPSLNLSTNGDNLLLVKDDDGNPENGYINAIDAIYFDNGSETYASNDPYGPTSTTQVSSSDNDNGYYLNTSDTLDLGNNDASNWTSGTAQLANASYGRANTNGTETQGLFTYQGTHQKVSGVNVTNFSGFGDQSITLNWTLPDGYSKLKNNIYVIIENDTPWTASEFPARFDDLSGLTANSAYGSGYQFGSGTGSYLVYKGDSNLVNITNLTGGAQNYFVRVYTIKDDFMYYAGSDTSIYTTNQNGDISLPVQLAYFHIDEVISSGNVKLSWRTESEINNAYFLIQKQNAGLEFETIAQIKGQGSKTSATDYEFVDENVQSGDTLFYRLADVAYDGTITYHEPKTIIAHMPREYKLSQNFPNPFNPSTSIVYHLPEQTDVTLTIYNVLGQKVMTLVNQKQHRAGIHRVQWNGVNQSGQKAGSGLYIIRMQTNKFTSSRKMLLLK